MEEIKAKRVSFYFASLLSPLPLHKAHETNVPGRGDRKTLGRSRVVKASSSDENENQILQLTRCYCSRESIQRCRSRECLQRLGTPNNNIT